MTSDFKFIFYYFDFISLFLLQQKRRYFLNNGKCFGILGTESLQHDSGQR